VRTRVLIYGGLLAAGALVLQVLDYQRFALGHSGEIYAFLIAASFLALGVGVGMRIASPPAPPFDGNPKAVAALGISARELEVLELIATGRTTQEIADRLGLSPNTVKTHVNRLFEKLEASKRIEAVQKARELGIVR
jgi:DNA-binding CsgD family transcriptional regulator